jgi:two-component system, chemotaxis family, protein-glutamate methylesterase/glutaminase
VAILGSGEVRDVTLRDVVVVGASAGGVEALRTLVAGLPSDFPACVLVVLHTPATSRSALAAILDRSGPLPAAPAQEEDRLEPGRILVAPPDRHLIVYDRQVTLSRGPRENGHRPAVDVLFRSAARALGPRVIAVVLSGTLDDGAAGLVAVHRRGGLGVVQSPEDAMYASMPRAAIAGDHPSHVLPVAEMPALLARLVHEEVGTAPGAASGRTTSPSDPRPHESDHEMETEIAMAALDGDALNDPERPGTSSGFACPDCHGVLFEIQDGDVQRFRCRVGHAWSPHSLAAQQTFAVEGALWIALRALEEKAALADRMSAGARGRGHVITAQSFAAQAAESRASALVLRDLIEQTTALEADVDGGADVAASSAATGHGG